MTRLYSSREVCRLTGCSYRQLDYWCRVGTITPVRPAMGSGSSRGFSFPQVVACLALVRLASAFLGSEGELVMNVVEMVEQDIPERYLLINSLVMHRSNVISPIPFLSTGVVTVVDVEWMRHDVDKAVKALVPPDDEKAS